MTQKHLDGWHAAALVLFALILFMLGAAFGHAVPWKALQDAAQAWATVAAVFAALWVGSRQLSAARAEAHDRAVVTAARLVPVLQEATDHLRHTITFHIFKVVDFKPQDGQTYRMHQVEVFDNFQALLQKSCFRAPHDQLVQLSGLGHKVAPRLAMGFAMLEGLATHLIEWKATWGVLPVEVREAQLNEWMHQITHANELLDAGFRVCMRVAAQEARRPVPEELYGQHS